MKFSLKLIILTCFVLPLTLLFAHVVFAESLSTVEQPVKGGVSVTEAPSQSFINASKALPQSVVRDSFTVSFTPPDNSIPTLKEYARSKVGDAQFVCLESLWTKESGWDYQAKNDNFSPSSEGIPENQAYGIPQSGPGLKMATSGADWKTNPRTQIDWGIWYIANSSYGTPCAAWNHSVANNWY